MSIKYINGSFCAHFCKTKNNYMNTHFIFEPGHDYEHTFHNPRSLISAFVVGNFINENTKKLSINRQKRSIGINILWATDVSDQKAVLHYVIH